MTMKSRRTGLSMAVATVFAVTTAGLGATAGPAAATTVGACAPSAGQVYEGGPGDDVFDGTDGDDVFYGRGGNDIVYGHGGNDEIHGGGGDDILYGGPCNDDLYGADGRDILTGSTGADELHGAGSDDVLLGDTLDTLDSGSGTNYCDVTNLSQNAVETSFTYFIFSYDTFVLPATAYAC
jgi:Ca2+-binding RTX toxin-like protein